MRRVRVRRFIGVKSWAALKRQAKGSGRLIVVFDTHLTNDGTAVRLSRKGTARREIVGCRIGNDIAFPSRIYIRVSLPLEEAVASVSGSNRTI
jgi:hypothetical protein